MFPENRIILAESRPKLFFISNESKKNFSTAHETFSFYSFQAKKSKGISMKYPKRSTLVCKPNTMRQKNGFPPNFVHSLDSSHMMLTSLYLWSHGTTFASVHDCYWTHASDVEIMNRYGLFSLFWGVAAILTSQAQYPSGV